MGEASLGKPAAAAAAASALTVLKPAKASLSSACDVREAVAASSLSSLLKATECQIQHPNVKVFLFILELLALCD